jgi:hypothetical protein
LSDEDRQVPPPRPPQPTGRVGNRIAGLFLILFAILLILAGGGCTILLLAMGGGTTSDAIPLILISLVVLGGGLTAMWFGVRLMRGRYD